MAWKPPDHVDEVRGWMKAKGWEVAATDYYFEQDIHSLRHHLPGGNSLTLRVTRGLLENNPAFVILYHLDRLNVAREIQAQPGVRLVSP